MVCIRKLLEVRSKQISESTRNCASYRCQWTICNSTLLHRRNLVTFLLICSDCQSKSNSSPCFTRRKDYPNLHQDRLVGWTNLSQDVFRRLHSRRWEVPIPAWRRIQFLQDNEVIVGLYGVKGLNDHITSLGFIVIDSTNLL